MKNILIPPFFYYYSVLEKIYGKKYEYVFIVSHMRSGSSLLTHILCTNPEICGYGEAHVEYKDSGSLSRLLAKASFYNHKYFALCNKRYLLDKVLHNRLLGDYGVGLIKKENIKLVFLLRDPLDSLKSIRQHQKVSEKAAVEYYLGRLEGISRIAGSLKPYGGSILVTYEDLVNKTGDAFSSLEKLLNLEEALKDVYEVKDTTGRSGVGDTSENIKQGKIVKKTRHGEEFSLDPEAKALIYEKYDACCQKINEMSGLSQG